jgi:hypothetical protein
MFRKPVWNRKIVFLANENLLQGNSLVKMGFESLPIRIYRTNNSSSVLLAAVLGRPIS